ncbi:MAG: hypothetical protein M3R38_33005 [Actinomycetota bacterium]|nr:hypothetical protein [Actinomycetota bacterium]MDP9487532.1 hypothetical protein [Actinomycetota bacterium]
MRKVFGYCPTANLPRTWARLTLEPEPVGGAKLRPEGRGGGKLRRVRRDEASNEGSAMLPPGYSLEAGEPGLLLLRCPDGSVAAAFAFSAFGPTPQTILEAAEADRLRRRTPGGGEGKEGRGR